MTVLAGIASLIAASLLLVQSASATTDIMNTTTEGEEGAITNDSTTTTNNVSNALLGNLFYSRQGVEANVNPINETYSVISYSDSVMIMPPNAPGVVINATETGDFTINILPNGLTIGQGQGFIMTEDGGAAEGEEENATVTYVSLSRTNPDRTGSGTGVVFFSTNSTRQLAFLDNMVGITQIEFSPEGSTGKIREWNGGSLAPENGDAAANGNQTTTSVS